MHKFKISHTSMTFNEDQDHPNWYQNTEFKVLYHISQVKEIGL